MPIHVTLVFVALLPSLILWRRQREEAICLASAVIAGALLFCLVLRWQPFHSRLHMPLLIIAAPQVGLLLQRRFLRFAVAPLLLLLTVTTAPDLLAYPQRPALGAHSVFLAPADEQQYQPIPELREPYLHAIELLREHQAHDVGFISSVNDWEYPLAAYGNFHGAWRIDHVLLPSYAPPPAEIFREPDALVCTRPGFGETIELHGRSFLRIYAFTARPANGAAPIPVSVYLPFTQPSR